MTTHYKLKAGTWIKNILPKGPAKKITFLEDPHAFKKKIVLEDPSSIGPRQKTPKYVTSYVDCPELSSYLDTTCSESMP